MYFRFFRTKRVSIAQDIVTHQHFDFLSNDIYNCEFQQFPTSSLYSDAYFCLTVSYKAYGDISSWLTSVQVRDYCAEYYTDCVES